MVWILFPEEGKIQITALSKVPTKGVGEVNFGKISNRCIYNSVNILFIFCCNNLTEGAHSL